MELIIANSKHIKYSKRSVYASANQLKCGVLVLLEGV